MITIGPEFISKGLQFYYMLDLPSFFVLYFLIEINSILNSFRITVLFRRTPLLNGVADFRKGYLPKGDIQPLQ